MAIDERKVVCRICPHACELREGQRGRCRARVARGGDVICESYGRVTSIALDPIEKKPLVRYLPGSLVLSLGSYGCNLHCPFCQNASIAAAGPDDVPWREMTPRDVVKAALRVRSAGNVGIAYTYNEPLIGFEFVRDTAILAHKAGLKNVVVTNGMINPGPLAEILPLIDAANVDLKGFTPEAYRILGGDFEATKRTIEMMAARSSCHLELTTLIVPQLNDSVEQMEELSSWVASIDPEIPLHVSRFFPCHHMEDEKPTPVLKVYGLADVARKRLKHVYTGNC